MPTPAASSLSLELARFVRQVAGLEPEAVDPPGNELGASRNTAGQITIAGLRTAAGGDVQLTPEAALRLGAWLAYLARPDGDRGPLLELLNALESNA